MSDDPSPKARPNVAETSGIHHLYPSATGKSFDISSLSIEPIDKKLPIGKFAAIAFLIVLLGIGYYVTYFIILKPKLENYTLRSGNTTYRVRYFPGAEKVSNSQGSYYQESLRYTENGHVYSLDVSNLSDCYEAESVEASMSVSNKSAKEKLEVESVTLDGGVFLYGTCFTDKNNRSHAMAVSDTSPNPNLQTKQKEVKEIFASFEAN